MHKGTQVTESMLLKGANLTAVGELVYTPMGVKMLPPSGEDATFVRRGCYLCQVRMLPSSGEDATSVR